MLDPSAAPPLMDMFWQQTNAIQTQRFKEGILPPNKDGSMRSENGFFSDGSRVSYVSAACDGWRDGNRDNNEGVVLQTIEVGEKSWEYVRLWHCRRGSELSHLLICTFPFACMMITSMKLFFADFNKLPPLKDGSVPAPELAKFMKGVFDRYAPSRSSACLQHFLCITTNCQC